MKTMITQRFKKPSTRKSEKREAKLVGRYPYVRLARIDSSTVTMTMSLAWKTNDPAPSEGLEDRRRTAKMSFWPGARRVVNNAGVVALVAANVSEIGYTVSRSIVSVAWRGVVSIPKIRAVPRAEALPDDSRDKEGRHEARRRENAQR